MSKNDPSRRALIAGAASLPVATIPALIPSSALAIASNDPDADPIFAAIAAHRQAWKNVGGHGRDIEDADWVPEEEARAALVNPTTIAGAAALLRYIHDHEETRGKVACGSYDVWVDSVYLNIADVLEGRAAP